MPQGRYINRHALVLAVCFLAGAALVARAERAEPVPARTPFDRFPMQIDGWRGVPQPPLAANILAVLGVDDYLTRVYVRPDQSATGLYIGYYGSQRQGDTMHSPQNCLPGAGWQQVSNTFLPMSLPSTDRSPSRSIVVNRYVVQKGVDKLLVLYWYQSHGRVVASEYWGKFYLIRDAIRLNRTDGALVRVTTPILGETRQDEVRAENIAVQFVEALFAQLDGYLPL